MLVARESVDRVVCVGKSDAPDLTGGTNMSGIDCLTLVTRNLLQAQTDRPCRRKLSSNHPAGSPWLAQRGVRSSTSMNYLVLTYPPVDETDRRCPYPPHRICIRTQCVSTHASCQLLLFSYCFSDFRLKSPRGLAFNSSLNMEAGTRCNSSECHLMFIW